MTRVTADTLAGLATLYSLSLAHNLLTSLPAGWLRPCPALARLDLAHNRLVTLQPALLTGPVALTSLQLGGNLLSSLAGLPPLPALSHLGLDSNPLGELALCELAASPRLTTLTASNCSLHALHDCPASPLPALATLDISQNWLGERPLQGVRAASLPSLTALSLAQRNMTVLRAGALAGLHSLTQLKVTGAEALVRVEPAALADLTSLTNLSLANNPRLTFLPAGLLPAAGQAEVSVVLAGCTSLATLDPACLPWSRLASLDLADTRLECDCRLAWLPTRLAALPRPVPRPALCAAPPALVGRKLKEIGGAELRCALLGPAHLSALSVCLVLLSLSLGCVTFACYTCRRPKLAIADLPGRRLQFQSSESGGGKGEERGAGRDSRWTFLQPDCQCGTVEQELCCAQRPLIYTIRQLDVKSANNLKCRKHQHFDNFLCSISCLTRALSYVFHVFLQFSCFANQISD